MQTFPYENLTATATTLIPAKASKIVNGIVVMTAHSYRLDREDLSVVFD
jgi:hypothetical protein